MMEIFRRRAVWYCLLVLACTPPSVCTAAEPEPLTISELCKVLGLTYWRVPVPPDGKQQWTIAVEPYRPTRKGIVPVAGSSDSFCLIALRYLKGTSYEFTLTQNGGTSRGELDLELRGASGADDHGGDIAFHTSPLATSEPNVYVIADIANMHSNEVELQLVIRLEPVLRFPDSEAIPLRANP